MPLFSCPDRASRYNRLSDDARRRLCFDNRFVWEVAHQIDYPHRGGAGGRPNQYPLWVYFLWLVLIHEYGSSRKVEEAFEDSGHSPWHLIRQAAQRRFSEDRPDLVPPKTPPTRNQFNYALKHHLPANAGIIAEVVREQSRRTAAAMGLGTADAAGSLSRPTRQRVAYGDVTVMTARTRRLRKEAREVDPDTGEIIIRRHDPDAALHTTGGGGVASGLPFAFTHLRGSQRNQQIILAIDPVRPQGTSEGHLVVDQYLEAAQDLSGLVGYAYDRALRGVHLDRLLKAGHIGLVGVHRSGGKPADRYHGLKTHHPTNREPAEVEIHLVGGAPHIRTYDVDGNQHLQPLHRRRLNKRLNKATGTYRMSAEYNIDGPTGDTDGYIRIRLDHTTEDELTGYNRPEHLRAFPEDDAVFVDIQKPLRASAESANRTIDDHHPRERLHHFGFTKNQLSMLAWQTYRNAQTEAVFAPTLRRSTGDPPLQRAS